MADLIEITESLSGKVDAEGGIIRGVKIVGLESKHNRRYEPDALRAAVGLYEGAAVNVDHKKGDRPYTDRLGMFANVHFREGGGLFGDLKYNPEHPASKTLAWWANNAPGAAGFSHVAYGKQRRGSDGAAIIESIQRVESVDLVANPATTKGLFESAGEQKSLLEQFQEADESERQEVEAFIESENRSNTMDLKDVTLAQLRESRPDLVTGLTESVNTDKTVAELQQKLQESQAEIEKLKADAAKQSRRQRVVELCKESGIQSPPDSLVDSLVLHESEEAITKAVKDLAPFVSGSSKPVSREQRFGESTFEESTGQDFGEDSLKKFRRQLMAN